MAIVIRELVVKATVQPTPPARSPGSRSASNTRLSPQELERVVEAVIDALRAERER